MICKRQIIIILCYFWYFRVSIEIGLECLLRGLEHQVAILTVPNVTFNNLSHAWRKPALQVFANQADGLSAGHRASP
jgi:hypothetical protein